MHQNPNFAAQSFAILAQLIQCRIELNIIVAVQFLICINIVHCGNKQNTGVSIISNASLVSCNFLNFEVVLTNFIDTQLSQINFNVL